jgi:hypothetical protein
MMMYRQKLRRTELPANCQPQKSHRCTAPVAFFVAAERVLCAL